MTGSDIIITAVEGGINHWASVLQYSHTGRVVATIRDEDGQDFKLTAQKLTDASRTLLKLYPDSVTAQDIRQDDIDADAADAIVQVACYGKIVYG